MMSLKWKRCLPQGPQALRGISIGTAEAVPFPNDLLDRF